MARRITAFGPGNVDDISGDCRACLQWNVKTRDNVERLLREWGRCGFISYEDKRPSGFILFGPAKYFPRSGLYPAGPVSRDAIFLACLYVEPKLRGRGIGKRLITAVEREFTEREFKALEALAGRDSDKTPAIPLEFLLERGFYILRDDRRHPLVRLDIKSLAAWSDKAAEALAKLPLKRPIRAKTPAKAPVG